MKILADPLHRQSLSNLLREERSGSDLLGVAAFNVQRLHRARRGNISILFIFMYLGFFTAAATVWNTGHTIAARVHNQTAADSAAYNAAVWTSRCVNNVVGSNMLILRHLSAQAVSDVLTFWLLTGVPGVPYEWAKAVRDLASIPFVGPALAAGMSLYILAVELRPYLKILFRGSLPALANSFPMKFVIPINYGSLIPRIDELFRYQQAWIHATPGAINQTRLDLEKYYGCKIRLTRPPQMHRNDRINNQAKRDARHGRVTPPLDQGNFLHMLPVLMMRFLITDNNWKAHTPMSTISVGKGNKYWNMTYPLPPIMNALLYGSKHHILVTQARNFLEWGPLNDKEWSDFSVVATVWDQAKSRGSAHGSSNLVGPGIFRKPVSPGDDIIAYAEAETYNGISETPVMKYIPYPFRVWTTWGWQWEPRLTLGRHLDAALKYDRTAANYFRKISVKPSNYGQLKYMALH